MPSVQLTKAWSISPNVRNVYVSLPDMAGWWIYENHAYLKSKAWVVVGTSDGLTAAFDGPGTDRLASKANAQVRGASAAAPQSWSLLENADGVQLLIAYQGASDDIIRISFSPGGIFVVAGTATHQPTATDEVIVSAANSVINATASLDRVMTIWASDDTKHWSNITFRGGTILGSFGVERINDLTGTSVFSPPYVGYRHTAMARSSGPGSGPAGGIVNTAIGVAGFVGTAARVITSGVPRLVRVGGGEILVAGAANITMAVNSTFIADKPALLGGLGSSVLPVYWSGERVANFDGFIGYPIDWWQVYTSSVSVPAVADALPGYDPGDTPGVTPVRSNWLISLGSAMVRPWRNVSATLQTG
jgi:hypothetical protein